MFCYGPFFEGLLLQPLWLNSNPFISNQFYNVDAQKVYLLKGSMEHPPEKLQRNFRQCVPQWGTRRRCSIHPSKRRCQGIAIRLPSGLDDLRLCILYSMHQFRKMSLFFVINQILFFPSRIGLFATVYLSIFYGPVSYNITIYNWPDAQKTGGWAIGYMSSGLVGACHDKIDGKTTG